MKRILFPTDFSEASFNAFTFALELAHKWNASITTIHAYYPTVAQPGLEFPFDEKAIQLLEFQNYTEAAELMHRSAVKEQHGDIPVEHMMQEGFPVEVILNSVQKLNADAIVIGSKGGGGFGSRLLGTTTSSIVEKSNIPVFIVPGECCKSRIKKIAFSMNLHKVTESDIGSIIDLATILNAQLSCFHVDTTQNPEIENKAQAWRDQYPIEPTFEICPGNYILDGIMDYCDKNEIDMLVMKTHKHSFLQSLFRVSYSRQMSIHSKIPVCILKG